MVADSMAMASPPQSATSERDLRLDLFRGLALWLIFLDHIPQNIVNWITIRNYGFSDATEIFIFISGYTAAFVYGRTMRERGFVLASARILRRAWQIYVAHIFLFTIFMAEIAYVAATFENPLYAEEMKILDFLKQPDITIFQALLLKFKPVNMDVLPLYIVLLLLFPPMLFLLLRHPNVALGGSALVYAFAWRLDCIHGWSGCRRSSRQTTSRYLEHGDAMLGERRIPASIESQTMPGLTFGQLEDFTTVSVSRIWLRGHRTGTNQRVKSTSMPNVR